MIAIFYFYCLDDFTIGIKREETVSYYLRFRGVFTRHIGAMVGSKQDRLKSLISWLSFVIQADAEVNSSYVGSELQFT